MDGLTEGRIVHYVLPNNEHRPAIVVRVWPSGPCEGYANLQVFTDGANDLWAFEGVREAKRDEEVRSGLWWQTSICYSEEKTPGTWHWIEKA